MSDMRRPALIAVATILALTLLKVLFGPGVTWVVASCVLSFCFGALWWDRD